MQKTMQHDTVFSGEHTGDAIMVNVKFNRKELLKAVKDKDRPERSNYTFRLNAELYGAFKKQCEEEKVTPTAVIEEFLREFTGS